MIENLYDIENLYRAFLQVKKVSGWKAQTQLYNEDLFANLYKLRQRLMNGTYVPRNPNIFLLNERGKVRVIESYCVEDRIVQGCFVQNVLMPICFPKLIYDNDASVKRRGTSHFRNRLEKNLHQFAKEHGNEGYILIGDFRKFFYNIRHEAFLRVLKSFGADDDVLDFTRLCLKQHEVDVSYMSDNEYENCMDMVFDALEYYQTIPDNLKAGEKMMPKSVGIGAPVGQIAGVITPSPLDNYIKIVRSIKRYGRYMDDFYIIHESKEFLQELLIEIKGICDSLGLILNMKKTQIIPLRHRFTILKTQYYINDIGKVVKIPCKENFTRERKRLKKFKKKLDNGSLTLEKITSMYLSWRNSIVVRFGENRQIKNMDNLFQSLFGGDSIGRERTN